jgi:hypothetical protein
MRLLGSLSFANLCALNLWHDSQRLESRSVDYFRGAPAGHTVIFATLLVVLGLTIVFFFVASFASRVRGAALARGLRLVFLLAFLYPIQLLHYVVFYSELPAPWQFRAALLLFACYGGVVGAAAWYWFAKDDTPIAAVARLNLALAPLLPIILAGHALYFFRSAPGAAEFSERSKPHAKAGPLSPGRRVLWLVFDEFDYDLAFVRRSQGLQLPELDRLRRESLFADNAYPPFGETLGSMPSLINGRSYAEARVTGMNSLELRSGNGDAHVWGQSETVFARLSDLGARTSVVGWYHPYCRIFGETLGECTFVPATKFVLLVRESYVRELGVPATVVYLLLQQLRFLPLVPKNIAPNLDEIARSGQIAEYGRVHRTALEYVRNPDLDFVMVHYPIPHPYGIYDRGAQTLTLAASSSYLDNLALADRVLGELRGALEAAGLWNRTAVILSSDHSLRDPPEGMLPNSQQAGFQATERGMGRIPFLVRIPGDDAGMDYLPRMNTVVTARLILALAQGRIRSARELADWLQCPRSGAADPQPAAVE